MSLGLRSTVLRCGCPVMNTLGPLYFIVQLTVLMSYKRAVDVMVLSATSRRSCGRPRKVT
jgi:hypothetical protein